MYKLKKIFSHDITLEKKLWVCFLEFIWFLDITVDKSKN